MAETKVPVEEADKKPKKAKQPNDSIDISEFDYMKLEGESFEKYMKLVSGLNGHASHDFTQYMASGIFKKELNANLDPIHTLIGIKINRAAPVNTTRIPVKIARDLNDQINNRDNPPSNSRFYLLKKTV